MKSELMKFFRSKKSKIVAFLFIGIMILDNVIIFKDYIRLGLEKSEYLKYTHATFLAGASHGHLAQIIIFWFLPIFLLLLYSDKIINEIKSNEYIIEMVKKGKWKYVINKVSTGFVIGSAVMLVGLLLNLILSYILFKEGQHGFISQYAHHPLRAWQNDNALLANIIYIISTSFFSGIMMSITVLLALVIKEKKITYIISFIVWFYLTLRRKFSIIHLFQLYTEYGLDNQSVVFVESSLYFIIIAVICYLIINKRRSYV